MKNTPFGFVFLFALLTGAPAANGASITYTFTGAGSFTGTDFTFVDPAGFLTFDTGMLTPTSSTDLFYKGTDEGPLSGFDFQSSTNYALSTALSGVESSFLFSNYQIGALTAGEPMAGTGTLTISDTVASATPEPSGLLLSCTGLIGVLSALRRRITV